MKNSLTQFHYLRPVDVLIIAFITLLSVFNLLFMGRIHAWDSLIFINTAASFSIILLAHIDEAMGLKFFGVIHDWYLAPAIFLVFKEIYVIIQSLGQNDWDTLLITADRAIFGVNPTVWLAQFSSPTMTEILQIAYASYYFIMLTVGIELYLKNGRQNFSFVLFTILYGFFLSYLGYLIFPAVGPRFTLHNFNALNTDLPGLWFTNVIRDLVNAGESIPKDVLSPIAHAQRDAFPSGHTQMTLLSLYFAYHYRLKSRYFLYLFGSLLIISTVYLRYHYVVDLIGGVVFMWFTLWTAPKLFTWWEKS